MSPHSTAENFSPRVENKDANSAEDEPKELHQTHNTGVEGAPDVMLDKTVEPAVAKQDDEANHLPIGPRLMLIVASLMLGVFCMALDNNIIAVAIPRITDEFHDLNDVGWYGSAYLLPACAFQLLFGKFYSLFSVKWVFLVALFIFEIGSLLCGVAPNSIVLMVGRGIAGLGSAGIFIGALVTIAHMVALEKRAALLGAIGGVYGVSSVVGPLMGGAFTDRITWRWCFYINLPLGAVTAGGILLLLRLDQKPMAAQESLAVVVKKLDPIGNFIFVPALICLFLALQWGGVTYSWSDGRIIAPFVIFGVVFIVFIILQVLFKDNATVPTRIASQRTIIFASLYSFCTGGSFFVMTYFIPIWFQAIKGVNPVQSGIDFLPLILPDIVAIIASGALVSAFGYYNPFFLASSVIMSIGAGLCTLFAVNSSQGAWVGYQFIYGFGVGLGFQQSGVAAQTVLPLPDVAVGTAVVNFVQIFGGAVFVSVAENLFANTLISRLLALNIPGIDPSQIVSSGATNLRNVVESQYLPQVLEEYNAAIVKTFQLALILSCISMIGSLGVEWRSVKQQRL